ncbi:hypothetical protein K8R42_05530, partial [bacterium]|nr:hypothetical protein [bacterium]
IGTFLTVLFLLVRVSSRQEIFSEIKKSGKEKNNQLVYFGSQGMGAVGSILQNYAVSLGSVALVASLQGLQYGLLLIISTLVTFFYPKIVKEDYSRKKIIKKIIAVGLIAVGLYFLTR